MPTPYIQKLSKEHGTSESKLEKYWKEAKEAAGPDTGDDKYYGLVTKIFKAKIKKHLNISEKMTNFKRLIETLK